MNGWMALWLAWGGFFLVVESVALLNDSDTQRDTLSQNVRYLRDRVKWGRWALGGGIAWLFFHLVFDL